MIDKNKSLTKYNDSFFNRIKKWIKSLFGKFTKSPKKNKVQETQINENYNSKNVLDKEKNESYNYQKEKKEFFELYEQVKNKKVNIKDLKYSEIKMINSIMFEEIKMKAKYLNNLKSENKQIEKQIEKEIVQFYNNNK